MNTVHWGLLVKGVKAILKQWHGRLNNNLQEASEMRRVMMLSVILALGLWTFVGAACAQKMELTVWHYWPGGSWREAIDRTLDVFDKEYPEIKVTRLTTEHEAYKTLIKILTTGVKPPDVFTEHQGWRASSINEHMADLTDLWDEKDYDRYFPGMRQWLIDYNGGLYEAPLSGICWPGFWYNKKVFADLGLQSPLGWDGFVMTCDKIKSAGIIPIAIGSQYKWPTYTWFESFIFRTVGLEFYEGLLSGEEHYTDPKVKRAFELWKVLVDKKFFDPAATSTRWDEALARVARGEAAMNFMGNWSHGQLRSILGQEPFVDYDYFPFPMIDAGVPLVTDYLTEGFFMHKRSQNPEAAKIFLDFIVSPKANEVFNRANGRVCPNVLVDEATVYDELSFKIAEQVKVSQWAGSYDLAQTAEMANYGLDRFVEFMTFPDRYEQIMKDLDKKADEVLR